MMLMTLSDADFRVEGLNQISHGTLRSMSECGAPTLRSLVIYGVSF